MGKCLYNIWYQMLWTYQNTGQMGSFLLFWGTFFSIYLYDQTLTSVTLKVKKQSESSRMLPYTVLAKQDQQAEQRRAKINTFRLNVIIKTRNVFFLLCTNKFDTHLLYLWSQASVKCWWWGHCSPPLAYSMIRYKVFSVSITSNNWTATNREIVTSNPKQVYTHTQMGLSSHLCLDDSESSWCVPLETTEKQNSGNEWSNSIISD